MWVSDSSFNAGAAFISGYDWATQSYTGLDRHKTELGRFRAWLIEKIPEHEETAKNLSWESYIGPGTSDADKFNLLRQLFEEFENSTD